MAYIDAPRTCEICQGREEVRACGHDVGSHCQPVRLCKKCRGEDRALDEQCGPWRNPNEEPEADADEPC